MNLDSVAVRRASRARVRCGDGDDAVVAPMPYDIVGDDCEFVELNGLGTDAGGRLVPDVLMARAATHPQVGAHGAQRFRVSCYTPPCAVSVRMSVRIGTHEHTIGSVKARAKSSAAIVLTLHPTVRQRAWLRAATSEQLAIVVGHEEMASSIEGPRTSPGGG